ncbi:MAG: hypothetical protein ACJ8CR_11055 [Roseiflexaceae bacterium]
MGRLVRMLPIVVLIALLQGSHAARAQTPQKERAFVYGINAAVESGFAGSFAPPGAPTLYLLAGQTSIISPRTTEIYFWSITNEYQADWSLVNETVPGKLEILRSGQPLATVDSTKYTIQYTPRGIMADAKLYLSAEAQQAQTRFEARQQAYQQASIAYYEAQQQWMAAVEAVRIKREAGQNVTVPPEPPQPAPIDIFSNGLNDGFPVKLDAGTYQIQVRGADGTIVDASRRELVVFASRRVAVGYTVVPEARWTTPDQVHDPSDVILGAAGSTLYLEPHVTREYPAQAYALLQNPQAHGAETSEWTWVDGEPLTDGQLEVVVGDQVAERHTLTPYRVRQIPGGALGYEVQPYVAGGDSSPAPPDFQAYPITLDPARPSYSIRLRSAQGTVVEGSARSVRAAARVELARLLLFPALPLVVGAFIITRRRRRMRLPRDVMK